MGVNYRQFKDKFVFAPNEMQQVAFEGAKQNECLEDGAERLWAMGDGLWARGEKAASTPPAGQDKGEAALQDGRRPVDRHNVPGDRCAGDGRFF